MRAMRSMRWMLEGWTESVTSREMPPVERFAVAFRSTVSPASGTDFGVRLRREQEREREVVDLDLRQDLLVADAAARVPVDLGDELLDRALPVADDEGRHALRRADEAARDDEEAEVEALQELLDDDLVAKLQGVLVGEAELVLAADVRQHAPAVRGVERLDDDRPAEPLGDLDGFVLVAGDRAPRHGHAVVAEERLGQALVAGDLDAELAGRRRDRRLDPLLVDSRAEHDERAVVEAQVAGCRAPRRRRTIERVEGPSAQRSRVRLSLSIEASRSRSTSRPAQCSTTSSASLPARTPTRSSSIS